MKKTKSSRKGFFNRKTFLTVLTLSVVVLLAIAFVNPTLFGASVLRGVKRSTHQAAVQPTEKVLMDTVEVTLSENTISHEAVRAQEHVPLVAFDFENKSGRTVMISELTFTGYINEDSAGAFYENVDNDVYISEVVSSARLVYNGNFQNVQETFDSEGKLTFEGLSLRLPAHQKRNLIVDGSITSTAYYNNTPEKIALDLKNVRQDVKLTPRPNTVAPRVTGKNLNGGVNPSVAIKVFDGGSLIIEEPEYSYVIYDQVAVAGDQNVLAARYKVKALRENFEIRELSLKLASHSSCRGSVGDVTIKYPTSYFNPTILNGTSTTFLDSNGNAHFNPENYFRVPLYDNDVLFEVYADFNEEIHSGCRVELDFDGEDTSEFMAVGHTSGKVLNHSAVYDVLAHDVLLYEAAPVFITNVGLSPTSIENNLEALVYAFDVTAQANVSGTSVGLYQLTFDFAVEGILTDDLETPGGVMIFETDGNGTPGDFVGNGTWSNNKVTITLETEKTIPAGQIKHFKLYAPITFDIEAPEQSLSISIKNDTLVPYTMNPAANVAGNNIWSDRSASAHTLLTSDWTNSFKLPGLPTEEFDLSQAASATLDIWRITPPDDTTYMPGTTDASLVALNFTAGPISPVTIHSLTLTSFIDEDGTGGYSQGFDNSISVIQVVDEFKLYDSIGNQLNNSYVHHANGEISFVLNNSAGWTIPANTTQKLLLKGDIYQNAHYNDNPEMLTFDIADAAADVEAVDQNGMALAAQGDFPNCGGASCVTSASHQTDITVEGGLSATITLTRTTPPDDTTYEPGTTDASLVAFDVDNSGSRTAFITQIKLTGFIDEDGVGGYLQGVDNSVQIRDVVSNLQLYDIEGTHISWNAPGYFDASGEAVFTGLSYMVPDGFTQKLVVKGDISPNANYNSTPEMIVVDIASASTDIVGFDDPGNAIVAQGDFPNCNAMSCVAPTPFQTDITVE